jgi:asparagine synthase (glutamine-hydrolysing)
MCGITGIIAREPGRVDRDILKKMTAVITHRGPDAYGDFFHGQLAFGHCRLAIIDLSPDGNQPMTYMNRYTITYNGEIYNYIELKAELQGYGYSFRSRTDTEVIPAAYDKWGIDCLNRFNGMWAFVLFDSKTGDILISRDRFGIKPLYYFKNRNYFIFGSEIKSLLQHPEVTREPDIDYCQSFIREGQKEYMKETAFKDIYRFLHASYLLININDLFYTPSPMTEKKYWQIKPDLSAVNPENKVLEQYLQQYYYLLNDSVKLRLRSDVRVGSALSGGIDSSTIVKLINENPGEKNKGIDSQETFSSVFKTRGTGYCDESSFIDLLSGHLKVRSNQVEPLGENLAEVHQKIVYHMDIPFDGTLMSAWHVFQLVKERGVTVTLDGQGADEQFGGYHSYLKHFLAYSRTPFKDYRLLKQLTVDQRTLIQGVGLNFLFKFVPDRLLAGIFAPGKKNPGLLLPLNHRLALDTTRYLTKHFHYGDRLSMAHSVESRAPFMDFRFVEFAAGIPAAYKIFNGWTKYIPRKAMENKLPQRIIWRKDKKGFPNPEEFWFKGQLKDWFCSEIESSPFLKYLHAGRDIRKRIESHGPISGLVRLLNLSTWYKIFFERDTAL